MTTVDAAGWLDLLVQDIAQADANSLHAVRTALADVAGSDPDTAVASVVEQLLDVRKHLTAVARQVFAARMASAGPTCSSASSRRCGTSSRLSKSARQRLHWTQTRPDGSVRWKLFVRILR